MNKMLIALGSLGLGAGIMYVFDPTQGRRRRARLRDASVRLSHTAREATVVTARDVQHRLTGLAARTRGRLKPDLAGDDVLVERVRARLGRLVSHPGAVDVKAHDGVVTLSGPVFESEVEQLKAGVAAIAGVKEIENRLEPHESAGHVPALQGRSAIALPRGIAKCRWTPATRLLAGTAGLALVALSSPSPTVRAAATRVAGLELLGRALVGFKTRSAA
jgi:hypothetical protein